MKTLFQPWALFFVIIIPFACSQVESSELASTKAEDVDLRVVLEDVDTEDQAAIAAYLQTLDSNTDIEFTAGESFAVFADTESGLTASETLVASSSFIDFDNSYQAHVEKTVDGGNYYLSYEDADGVITTIAIPAHTSAAILAPAEDATVGPDTVTITWNPDEMPDTGTIALSVTFDAAGSRSHTSISDIENTGSYDLDISEHSGTATIDLIHEEAYDDFEDYGDSLVRVRTISRVGVSLASH